MQAFDTIRNALSVWLDQVAESMIAAIVRFKSIPTVKLIEGDGNHFSVIPDKDSAPAFDAGLQFHNGRITGHLQSYFEDALKAGRVEPLLRSERFVFKTLELPSRAAEFLGGVVRSQIDRLTPWNADQAAFGVSTPAEVAGGRIAVTVAATAKHMLDPLLQAFTARGACSVKIFTRAPEASPDDTYLTELKIDSDKLRLTGIKRDAPNLIRLIEESNYFSQAAFFAPIIHSSSDPGDRFNIEARMEPDFSLAP